MEPGVIGMLIALVILVLASFVLWRFYGPKAAAKPQAKNVRANSARVGTGLFFVISNDKYITVCLWGQHKHELEKYGGFHHSAGTNPNGYKLYSKAAIAANSAANEHHLKLIPYEDALEIYC